MGALLKLVIIATVLAVSYALVTSVFVLVDSLGTFLKLNPVSPTPYSSAAATLA